MESFKEKFENEVVKYHEKLIYYVRVKILSLKRQYGLTDEELSILFNVEQEDISHLMKEQCFSGTISSHFLSTLFLLTFGQFNLNGFSYSFPEEFKETTQCYLNQFGAERRNHNINRLFGLLGIEDDDDLELVVSEIDRILRRKNDNDKEKYH